MQQNSCNKNSCKKMSYDKTSGGTILCPKMQCNKTTCIKMLHCIVTLALRGQRRRGQWEGPPLGARLAAFCAVIVARRSGARAVHRVVIAKSHHTVYAKSGHTVILSAHCQQPQRPQKAARGTLPRGDGQGLGGGSRMMGDFRLVAQLDPPTPGIFSDWSSRRLEVCWVDRSNGGSLV